MTAPGQEGAEAPPVPFATETAPNDPGSAGEDDRWLNHLGKVLQGEEKAQPLPAPEEIEQLVTQELDGKNVVPEERRRLTTALTLQRRHGGEVIACLHTPDGPIVLAVGRRQVGLLLKGIPAERRRSVSIEYPAPW